MVLSMNIFLEPIDLNQWNLFEKVKSIGHKEPFCATNEIRIDDLLIIFVGKQDKRYKSGVYAVGKVISEPAILTDENRKDDYCYGRKSVWVEITKLNYDKPLISDKEFKPFIGQYRHVHKIKDIYYDEILKKLSETSSEAEDIILIDDEANNKSLKGEEKQAFVKVRINQSVFRKRLLKRYKKCCLCGVEIEAMLRASHIKPWAESNAIEKLDVENGLLLCPNHDALFDSGLISFDDNGQILISNELTKDDRTFMNIVPSMKITITDGNRNYLSYHRKKYSY